MVDKKLPEALLAITLLGGTVLNGSFVQLNPKLLDILTPS